MGSFKQKGLHLKSLYRNCPGFMCDYITVHSLANGGILNRPGRTQREMMLLQGLLTQETFHKERIYIVLLNNMERFNHLAMKKIWKQACKPKGSRIFSPAMKFHCIFIRKVRLHIPYDHQNWKWCSYDNPGSNCSWEQTQGHVLIKRTHNTFSLLEDGTPYIPRWT